MSNLGSLFSTIARQAHLAPAEKCPSCGEEFTLGVNGTVAGCDDCVGIVRDRAGYAWQGETCTCCDPLHPGDNGRCPVHGGG